VCALEKTTQKIQLIKIDLEETWMALMIIYSTNNLPKILLFDIKSKNGKRKFLHEIKSLTKSLKLFDFSKDNCFLLYQQADEEEVQFFLHLR